MPHVTTSTIVAARRGALSLACLLGLCHGAGADTTPASLPPSPSLSEAARTQLAAMSQAPNNPSLTLAQMRAFSDQFQSVYAERQKAKYAVNVKEDTLGGKSVRVIAPAAHADATRILLNLHGGGMQLDSGSLTENIPIAALTGVTVVAVRYRLAPENPFPAAVDDGLAVYRALLKSYSAAHIGIYGTSGGAILGPELVARIRAERLPVPGALGYFSGDADFARPGDSLTVYPLHSGSMDYDSVRSAYAGSTALNDPLLSPLYAKLKGFPPTLCVTSSRDMLLSGTANFCRRLEEEGVAARLIVYDGLPHAFWSYIDAPESDQAFRTMAEFLVTRLGSHLPAPSVKAASLAMQRCQALASHTVADTRVVSATLVHAGPYKDAFMQSEAQLPEHCRVEGEITPEAGSTIRFEVWMPAADWNGRLYGAGNGGFAGALGHSPGLVEAVQRGAAGVSTDTGHVSKAANPAEDGSWALGHPPLVRDYGYRAIHLSAVTAKALAATFYRQPVKHAYFASCSNGGRQALMEAQRYPEDYDGIIAGAPAYAWTRLAANFIWNDRAQRAAGATIPASKVAALQAAVLKACPGVSGHAWVDDPQQCHFDPQVLTCTGAENDQCLNAAQVAALRKIYAGPVTSSGLHIYPGFTASGAELGSVPGFGWDGWIFGVPGQGASQPKYAAALLTSFAPALAVDSEQFDFDRDPPRLRAALGEDLDATNPDLTHFAARGGRLILWHGWADPALPPQGTLDYFDAVRRKMGPKTDMSVRLFMVPGVQHCIGGPGPGAFGQFTAPVRPADAESDMAAALEAWVENQRPLKQIVARHSDNPLAGALDWRLASSSSTTLLCAFPAKAKYLGKGDRAVAGGYACTAS